MQSYSYDFAIRDNNGKVLKEYRENPSPVIRIPGVRDVIWDESIGRHVKL
jgi:hypothetical protein